ncbi:MAG TPA: DegT/DnrJ/EryC1/StrS family aminotransferase [Prolixibacteraceae bacterium]|jgi:perosamine synthetase
MDRKFIPIAAPIFNGNEKKYVDDCIDSTWVSSSGKYISLFESEFAKFCHAGHALSCSNGTVALHLALLAYGIGPGDEIIVPTFTYVATANCVAYCGAKPVFVDCDPETWNIDPKKIEEVITPKTKGIIVVHIYGHPADLDPIMEIAKENGLFVIEDAAEAHGAEYHGKRVGSIGDIATFSFFGNKIITTGEGGMVTTNNDELAAKMRQIKGQGVDPTRRYWFPMVGYNYRMTNVEAAIGLAQLERIDWHMAQRRRIASHYKSCFQSFPKLFVQPEKPYALNSYWMTSVLLGDGLPDRDLVMQNMLDKGIETRPFFYPMHVLPMYQESSDGRNFPVADKVSARGMNLPSSANLTDEDLDYISDTLLKILRF